MSLTLLIDLDDTLISNSVESFIPAYLKALGSHLADFADPKLLVSELLKSTTTMMENDQPNITLKERFDENFYPSINLEYGELHPAIEDFYAVRYPSLKELTKPRAEARKLVEQAINRDYIVAVATNPLFPKTAIYQRLRWGNLAPEEFDFSVISSYENFHFAKPNPAYFAELLAQIGWPEFPVLMVGNDREADIDSAKQLGLATYWVTKQNGYTQSGDFEKPLAGFGGLDSLLDWIDSRPGEDLQPQFNSPVAIDAIMKSTPAALSTLTQHLKGDNWKNKPIKGEWSPVEIICHLRDVDKEINLPRIKSILTESNPFIEAIDADKWTVERNYQLLDGAVALSEFIGYRLELIGFLSTLKEEDWLKEARHTIFGPTTLLELLKISARHDRLHIQQIVKTLENH